jgi:hypothetical protein
MYYDHKRQQIRNVIDSLEEDVRAIKSIEVFDNNDGDFLVFHLSDRLEEPGQSTSIAQTIKKRKR